MCSQAYSVRVSLEPGFSARFEDEKGLLDEDEVAVFCPGAEVARWMDIVLRIPFSLMINECSTILTIEKGPIVFGICLLSVVVSSLSVALTEEAASSGLAM